jgi:hypothetical protein
MMPGVDAPPLYDLSTVHVPFARVAAGAGFELAF